VIDYRSQNVGEVATGSRYAPFAAVLDCVGGTEVIPYMDELLLEDPKRPDLGVYVSISGDSESFWLEWSTSDSQSHQENPYKSALL
jgi:hypothetical protein